MPTCIYRHIIYVHTKEYTKCSCIYLCIAIWHILNRIRWLWTWTDVFFFVLVGVQYLSKCPSSLAIRHWPSINANRFFFFGFRVLYVWLIHMCIIIMNAKVCVFLVCGLYAWFICRLTSQIHTRQELWYICILWSWTQTGVCFLCDVTHFYVWYDWFIFDMTQSYVARSAQHNCACNEWDYDTLHGSFTWDMTHSYTIHIWQKSTASRQHGSFICDMTHSYVTWLIHMGNDSFVCDLYMTWLHHT